MMPRDSQVYKCVDGGNRADNLLTLTMRGLWGRLARVRASVSMGRPKEPGKETWHGILNYVLTIHCIVRQHTIQSRHIDEM